VIPKAASDYFRFRFEAHFWCRGFTRIVLCFRLLFVLVRTEKFSGAWHPFSLAPQIRMPYLTACVPFCQRRFLLYSTLAFAFQYTHYWELSVIPFWCGHLHPSISLTPVHRLTLTTKSVASIWTAEGTAQKHMKTNGKRKTNQSWHLLKF